METRVGISGWRYPPWRKVFYPPNLIQAKELSFASREVNTIEINGSFYSMQTPKSYKKWYEDVPKDFIFSVKGPRYITHIRRLRDIENPLANFFASGVLHLKEKLGPILWQFPPSFRFDEEKFENFLKLLPSTFAEAVRLSKKADRLEPDFPASWQKSSRALRHAVEIRNTSFENPLFVELLRKHGVALVFADTAGLWPYFEDVTSDFVYLRLHGDEELYASGYSKKSIRWWAERIRKWQNGESPKPDFTLGEKPASHQKRDVFVYFDNTAKLFAPTNAQDLAKLLRT